MEMNRESREELCSMLHEWLIDHTRDHDIPLLKAVVRIRDVV
jgi:hemerythrin